MATGNSVNNSTNNGATVAPDKQGVVQGDGGSADNLRGSDGNDRLEGQATQNSYFGGKGNDTFILNAKFGQETDVQTVDFSKQSAFIQDFAGAAGSGKANNGTGENDFIAFTTFGEGSTLDLVKTGTSNTPGATLYYYAIFDTHTGKYFNFEVNSLNGKALGAGDYAFTSSTSNLYGHGETA